MSYSVLRILRFGAVALVVPLGLAWPLAAASARRVAPSCRKYRCRTLAETQQLRVVQARQRHVAEIPYQSTFALWRPSGRFTRLGDEMPGPDLEVTLSHLSVAGRYAAYALEIGGTSPVDVWKVCRVNVQEGKSRECAAAGQFPSPKGGVRNLVLTPKGTVAWITAGAEATPTVNDVFELRAGSRDPQHVASSATIDYRSLAAVPGRIYWLEGDGPRTVTAP